jgi:hypothetical protein
MYRSRAGGAGHRVGDAVQGSELALEALHEGAAMAEEPAGADYLRKVRQFLVADVATGGIAAARHWRRSHGRAAVHRQFLCAHVLFLSCCYSLAPSGQPAAAEPAAD